MTDTRDTAAPQICQICGGECAGDLSWSHREAAISASPTAPPPTQPEGHEAWMLEAERLIVRVSTEACMSMFTAARAQYDEARVALLAHLRKKGE
jgi:hypothetical protein